jgi:hypothetical protein
VGSKADGGGNKFIETAQVAGRRFRYYTCGRRSCRVTITQFICLEGKMKKYIQILYVFIVCFFLFGCTTLQTYIENAESDYTNVPIVTKHVLIFGEQFIMGDYSLDYKGNTSELSGTFLGNGETTIRNYVFYKNKIPLYKVEIAKWENKIQVNDSLTLYSGTRRYIRVINNDRSKEEYTINMDKQLPYITYQDNFIGTVDINYYESKNKNDLEYDWDYHTGFSILVNNEEYGILSLYPTSLYIKNNHTINDTMQDKLVLTILTTYASHLYQ